MSKRIDYKDLLGESEGVEAARLEILNHVGVDYDYLFVVGVQEKSLPVLGYTDGYFLIFIDTGWKFQLSFVYYLGEEIAACECEAHYLGVTVWSGKALRERMRSFVDE